MNRKIAAVISIVLIISILSYQKVQAVPIAVPAGAVVVIAGGLVVAGCYSEDHESMTEMVEYTWNNISTEMQQEAVRLSLIKDTGVIITDSLLSAIGNAITQRFGEQTGVVSEPYSELAPIEGGYEWPEGGVKSLSDTAGNLFVVVLEGPRTVALYGNGYRMNSLTVSDENKEIIDYGMIVEGTNIKVKRRTRDITTGEVSGWSSGTVLGLISGQVATVAGEGTWSWELDGNRANKEPKRIPLPPGGIPESSSEADDWAWDVTGGQTSDTIESPVANEDVTADTSGIAGAIRTIRNLVSEIADFFNPSLQPTLNMEPLKVSTELFTTRFPFSLPWDFLRAFESMETDGSWEPKFNFSMPAGLPVGNSFDMEIDLTMWNEVADVARKFELLCFDIGLIILTRRLLGGGV